MKKPSQTEAHAIHDRRDNPPTNEREIHLKKREKSIELEKKKRLDEEIAL